MVKIWRIHGHLPNSPNFPITKVFLYWLLIPSGGRHKDTLTDTHTHRHTHTNVQTKAISGNQACSGHSCRHTRVTGPRAPGLKTKTYNCVFITGLPGRVPGITVDNVNFNGDVVTFMLSWGESYNNFDPIVNYTVSCSGDVTCPPVFTTIDNTARSYTIANLTTMINYTFSVVATNSIGSGEASVVMITTTPGEVCMYV